MKIIRKISLVIIGIILSLVILEACLQIAGFTLTAIKKYKNKTIKDPNTVTILCLGESTTDGQWPPILQKILDEKSKNKKFNVIDEGIKGTNTIKKKKKINDNLIKYNPDIVVAMMGTNDSGLGYKKYKIKTFALFSLIKKHFTTKILYDDIIYIKSKIFEVIFKDTANAEKYLYKMHNIYKETNYNFGGFLEFFIIYAKNNEYKNKKILDIIDYHIINKEIFFDNELRDIVSYLKDYKKYDKEKIKSFIIKNKKRIHYFQVSTEKVLEEYDLLYLLDDIKNNKFVEVGYKNIMESNNLSDDSTKKNYEYIISEVYKNNKNSLFMPMQYPTLSVEELKNDLKDSPYYDKLIFISNEENFKQALQQYKTEEIFTDIFRSTFGHCTELGNTLIAENVAETILKLYN